MSKLPLTIRSVHVREAPGIPEGLEPLDKLTNGINVIYGPNASGKSTTLRLMQASLTPGGRNNSLRLAGDRAEVTVEGGDVTTQITLRDQNPPEAKPQALDLQESLVGHCRFSLKELLNATGRDGFEQRIAEAAAGGVNLIRTAEELGLDDRKTPRPKDRKDLQSLQRELSKAVGDCAAMESKEEDLVKLLNEAEELSANQERRSILHKAKEHRENLDSATEDRERLEIFPEVLTALSGHEADEIRKAESSIEKETRVLESAREDHRKAEVAIQDSILETPLPDGLLARTDKLREHLHSLELKRENLNGERAGAESRMETARRLIGDEVSNETLEQVGPPTLQRMETWCDRVEAYQSEAASVETLKSELGDLSPPPVGQGDENITLLRQWLAAAKQDQEVTKVRNILLGGAVVFLVLAIVLGLFVHPGLFALLLGTVTLAAGWWLLATGGCCSVERVAAESGLHIPANWDASSVNTLIRELEEDYGKELEQRGRHKAWYSRLSTKESELANKHAELETDRTSLSEEMGFAPIVGEKSFGILARRLSDWLGAYSDLVKAHTEQEENDRAASKLRNKLRDDLNDLIKDAGRSTFDSSEVAGWITGLRDQNEAFKDAVQKLENSKARVHETEAAIGSYREQISAIYTRAEVEEGEFRTLSELVSQVEAFGSAKREFDGHAKSVNNAKAFFNEHEDLAEWSADKLENEIELMGDPSDELQAVNKRIGAVEIELKRARHATDVEAKRQRFEEGRQELHTQRARRLEATSGWFLARHIHDEVSAENVPEVQKRAGELLIQFTNGRCEMTLNEGKLMALQPGVAPHAMEVENLSDGTRVQLFIAMRLAFVEKEEGAYRMPLFFDEALANTDDHRAPFVIKTLVSIAAAGRQIFYFTSQADESAKWRAALDQEDVDYKVMPLRPMFGDPPVTAHLAPPVRVLSPLDGESYSDFVERLKMQTAVDPWIQTPDEVQLVHVLDQPQDLARLLEFDIRSWGPLARLGAESSALCEGDTAFERSSRRAQFLFEVARLWQQGRGRPLKRSDLEEAGVTNTANHERLEQAWDEAENHGRDAESLCAVLEANEVKIDGLAKGGIEKMRNYCEENGFIVPSKPISDGELRIQAENVAQRIGLEDEDFQRLLALFSATR